MTALVLTALVAIALVAFGVRRAPLLTLLIIGLAGLAHHLGAFRIPTAVSAPVARARAALSAWQNDTSSALTCQLAETNSPTGQNGQPTDQAARLCAPFEP